MEQLSSWKIFSLRGVEIKVNISLLFLLLYVILTATASFPFIVKESGLNIDDISGSPVLWASVFAVALVLSILAHEMGHVVVAQSKGVKVKQIVLTMLGGTSQMERIPEEPLSEFKVAIVGPLISFLIAVFLFGLRRFTTSTEISLFSFWIGRTNLVLAIFNLLPAFPTDGGRVLRALLVTKYGRLGGTQVAVNISTVFAWLFGLIGFFYFNFILMLIGLFIYGAAQSELLALRGQIILKGMKVKDVLTTVSVLTSEVPLSDAVTEMTLKRQLLLPVEMPDKKPAIISSEMINKVPKEIRALTSVGEIAETAPQIVSLNDDLSDVWMKLLSSSYSAFPVADENKIVGLVSISDLIQAFELYRLTESPQTARLRWPGKLPKSKPV